MKSSIITIGNELLGGYTVDSNGAWIGRKLIDIGILPTWRTTVPDEKEEIINAMSLSVEKANVVICTGGLGPTSDDVTLDAYCDFVNTEVEIDEQYLEDLKLICICVAPRVLSRHSLRLKAVRGLLLHQKVPS